MVVTEEIYKRINVEINELDKIRSAEEYIKSQYGIEKELCWICTSTFFPYSSEPASQKWSASVDIKLKKGE